MAGYNNVNPSVSSDAPPSNLDTSLASSTTQVSADGLSTSSTGGYDYNYPTSSSNGMSSASLLASTSSMPTGYDGGETSSSQSPSISGSPRTVSPNGRCAGNTGYTCLGSAFGDCCSSFGYCGSSDSFCGMDCNPAFGSCASGGGYSSVSALRCVLVTLMSFDGYCRRVLTSLQLFHDVEFNANGKLDVYVNVDVRVFKPSVYVNVNAQVKHNVDN